MALTQLIVLAVLHGLSYAWPIGGDANALFFTELLRYPVAPSPSYLILQSGLLLAVMAYFWRDLADMAVGVVRAAKGKRNADSTIALQLAVATVPTLGLELAYTLYVPQGWATAHTIGWCIIGGSIVLLIFDSMSMTVKRVEHATYLDAIIVGLGQLSAPVPGLGAAAVSITLARLLGYERDQAARFYFLLSIPVSFANIMRDAYFLDAAEVVGTNDILAGVGTFFTALIAIAILMTWLRRSTYTPFVVYRLLLGGAVLALAYEWVVL